MESYIVIVLGGALALVLLYLLSRAGQRQTPNLTPTVEAPQSTPVVESTPMFEGPEAEEAQPLEAVKTGEGGPMEALEEANEVPPLGVAEDVGEAPEAGVEAKADEPVEVSSDLSELSGIGSKYQQLLKVSGITSIQSLSRQEPSELMGRLLEVNEREVVVRRPPPLKTVQGWVEEARLYVRY